MCQMIIPTCSYSYTQLANLDAQLPTYITNGHSVVFQVWEGIKNFGGDDCMVMNLSS